MAIFIKHLVQIFREVVHTLTTGILVFISLHTHHSQVRAQETNGPNYQGAPDALQHYALHGKKDGHYLNNLCQNIIL